MNLFRNNPILPTIYALATPRGTKSAIAILRVSGSQTKHIYESLTQQKIKLLKPRYAYVSKLFSTNSNGPGSLLDSPLTLYFPKPHSFTGEDMLEFHLHGGKAISNAVLRAIESLHDPDHSIEIRYAEPGEFSRRAFQNGKLDLTEVESINDLINAETEMQRKSVLSSFNGKNKILFTQWRKQLVSSMAELTALIDFADDNDMLGEDNHLLDEVETAVVQIKKEVIQFIDQLNKSRLLLDGIKLIFFGSPNVGKSSLLNCITNEDIAIVSDIPGTTRDSVNSVIDMNGYKMVLVDTAGIRKKSNDSIELIGIERAKQKYHEGDVCVLLVDATRPSIDPVLLDLMKQSPEKRLIVVLNKIDLVSPQELKKIKEEIGRTISNENPCITTVSCKTYKGISDLLNILTHECESLTTVQEGVEPIMMSGRVEEILKHDILYGINEFLRGKDTHTGDLVVLSENLQYAIDGIGKILGDTVGLDEVLDVVFSKFCIGK